MKKLFTTISIVLIAYFLITEYIENRTIDIAPQDPNPNKTINTNEKTTGNFFEKTVSNIILNILKTPEGQTTFAKIVQPVAGDETNQNQLIFKMNNLTLINNIFKIETVGSKNDKKAICGHVVDVEYELKDLAKGTSKIQREHIELGAESVNIGLSNIIVGMSEGQQRTGIIPERFADNNGDKISEQNVQVHLHKIISKQFVDISKIKIFDSVLNYYVPYLCGEKIDFKIAVSKFDGTEIFNSKNQEKISYRIGDHSFPIIFAYGIFNKMKSGTRTIIAPGLYFQLFDGGLFAPIKGKIKNTEYYMIDIINLIAP